MWTPLRLEISKICQQLHVSEERFKPVSLQDWQSIQEKVFEKFCYRDRIGRIWESLKGDAYAIQFHYNYPFDQLLNLVDHSEKVWLFVDETVSQSEKYWFYEGYINDIVLLLAEATETDEVYVASKKYEWLLCVNNHDYIIAAGNKMTKKLMNLEKST
ncbi:MAG: DUF6756 family protein [Flavisolibacter sp.]